VELVTNLVDAAHGADPDGHRGLDTHVYARTGLLLVVAEETRVPTGRYSGGQRRDPAAPVVMARGGGLS
jgi:hypothetical protein